jgi:hypothetical protein
MSIGSINSNNEIIYYIFFLNKYSPNFLNKSKSVNINDKNIMFQKKKSFLL